MRQQWDTGKDSCVIFKGEGASWATNSPRPGGPRPFPSHSPTWTTLSTFKEEAQQRVLPPRHGCVCSRCGAGGCSPFCQGWCLWAPSPPRPRV